MNLKKRIGFTLVELIVTISIISLLASIVIVVINPTNIFINARNSQRQNDLKTLSASFEKYFVDSGVNGVSKDFTSLTGYSAMVANATSGNPTVLCPNAKNLSSVSNPYILSTGTGSNTLSIDPLVQSGYLPKVLKDPKSGNPYKACIDPCNLQQLVIYSDTLENVSDNLNVPLGTIGLPSSGSNISYPCLVQSASVTMNVTNNTYPYCTGDNISITFPSTPTVGNLIVVTAWNYNRSNYSTSQIASVTDNMGNGSYSVALTVGGTNYDNEGIWYKKIVNTGSNFTVSGIPQYANGQNCSMITIQEYKGLASGTLDQTSSTITGMGYGFCTGVQDSGATPTTTQNTELLFGAHYINTPGSGGANSLNVTPGNGYTTREFAHLDNDALFTEDNVSTSTGSYTATDTVNINDCGEGFIIATFK